MSGEVILTLLQVAVLVFVVTSMLAMGLSLTIPQIIEPLKSVRLVVIALLINFVAVPILAIVIDAALNLEESLSIGLIIMATAAGAPFLPKLGQVAKGNVAFSVGLMVLLMVVTVAYMPIVMPLLIEGVDVDAWDIASSLIFLMLLPLTIGLVVRWRYEGTATSLEPVMGIVSTVALAFLIAGGVIVNWNEMIDLIGTGGILAIVLFLAVSLVMGYFGGGSESGTRSVLGLGTAQRNVSAALIVAGQNFADVPGVITFILVAAIVGLVLLMPAAGELGRRAERAS